MPFVFVWFTIYKEAQKAIVNLNSLEIKGNIIIVKQVEFKKGYKKLVMLKGANKSRPALNIGA